MVIGTRIFDLHIPGCRSLKEKRAVIKSLKARLRNNFNVSVAEVDHQNLWQRSTIAVVAVNASGTYVNGVLDRVLEVIAAERRVVILTFETEYL